jgi:hypothetical protein
MLRWSLFGKTLDRGGGGLEIYPYSFLRMRTHRWIFCFILVLFRTYIHGKQRLGPLYHEIGSSGPVAREFPRIDPGFQQVLTAHACL